MQINDFQGLVIALSPITTTNFATSGATAAAAATTNLFTTVTTVNQQQRDDILRNITKMVFLVMSILVTGYDTESHLLHFHKMHIDPCDAHRFFLIHDKHLCAATSAIINRLSLIMLSRLAKVIHNNDPTLTSDNNIDNNINYVDSLLRHLLLKLLDPDNTKWICVIDENNGLNHSNITAFDFSYQQHQYMQFEIETVFEKYNNILFDLKLKHNVQYINHSKSDMIENVVKLMGYEPHLCPNLQYIP